MSDPEAIVPSGIPQFTGDLDSLDIDTLLLSTEAGAFRDAGAGIHSNFQGVAAFYKAPEADQLFATTAPVAAKTATFADNLEKVSGALSAYSQQVRPLAKKLEDLQRQAFAFTASIEGDDHWRRDEKKRDHNDGLKNEVQATLQAFYEAEIACHNKITALVGGSTLVLGKLSGGQMLPKGTSAYGASADDLNHLDNAPWGNYAEPEYTGLSWLYHQGKSLVWDGFIVDGIWGTVTGLDILLGCQGWDAAGEAWKGLAKLATGLVLISLPGGPAVLATPSSQLPKWFRDSRTALKESAKAMVAYDEWGKNPARAAGSVSFNILTGVCAGGAGNAAKAGAVAKTINALGKVGRAVDPMTYVFTAGKFGAVKVGDLFGGVKNVFSGASKDILSGTGHVQPDGTVLKFSDDMPVVKGNTLEWPGGTRLNLDDSTVTLPNGVKSAAHIELSAADRALLEQSLPHHEPAIVGTHPWENAAGHAGDHPRPEGPRSRAGHTPGGTAHGLGRGPEASQAAGHGSPAQHAGSSPTNSAHHGSTATHQGNGSGGAAAHGSGSAAAHVPPSGGGGHGAGPAASPGPHTPLDPQVVDDRIKELDDRQGGEGHAPGRHLYPDDQALKARLGTVLTDSGGAPKIYGSNSDYAGLLKSENNIDPLTGTTVDGVHGRVHRVGPYATKFDNPGDMVRADQYFRDEIARTGEPPDATPIDQVLGTEGHERLSGYYRNPANHGEFLPVDFEGGTIVPVYRLHDGKWNLHTMFSNPAPGRHP